MIFTVVGFIIDAIVLLLPTFDPFPWDSGDLTTAMTTGPIMPKVTALLSFVDGWIPLSEALALLTIILGFMAAYFAYGLLIKIWKLMPFT